MSDQRLLFSKSGRACYISHLDLMRTFQRAFLRAGVSIKHTEGFNPHAFVSIALPLAVGYSSGCELLDFVLLDGGSKEEVPEQLNRVLPEGIFVQKCYDGEQPVKKLAWVDWTVALEYDKGVPEGAKEALEELLGRDSLVIQKKSKKAKRGFTEVDIIPSVRSFQVTEGEKNVLLRAVLSAQNPGLNPELILTAFRQACPELAPDLVRCHRNEVLDGGGKVFR